MALISQTLKSKEWIRKEQNYLLDNNDCVLTHAKMGNFYQKTWFKQFPISAHQSLALPVCTTKQFKNKNCIKHYCRANYFYEDCVNSTVDFLQSVAY